jgi:DnaK suppressor protein
LRKEYIAQAEEYETEADLLAQELETGDVGFDEEAGEGGAATVDRERNLLLSAQARQTATEIDDAVKRIAKGLYGLCLHCGQKIPKMRLKAIPHAELCVDCKAGGLLRRR